MTPAPSQGTITCSRCGSEVASGVHYCAICGNDVSGVQASLATEQMATPTGLMRGAEAQQQELINHLRQATLGEYEVLGELGRGGMATVYLAHEIALDRKVAIKVMSPALVHGEGMIERFKREARTAASLSHPNIIPVYAVRETDHLLYFVMKFVQGRPLDSIIKEIGPLPIPMVKAIMAQAGSAFGYAHRRGIVHRDIKPANIMIDDEGWAVVTDFGIAKVSETQGLTMTGMTVGTPTYMSPEQCMAQDVTGASDQYSLGVVGYEMITGRPPFTGGSMMTIMYGHFNEAPPPIPPLRPDCPADLQTVIMQMLEKDPGKRWPTVDDAVAAVGAQALSHDDPTRTQLVSLAKEGAAKTQALIGKMSVPLSPIPGSRSRPGVTAPNAASAASSAPTAVTPRGIRPQTVPAPSSGMGKGALIGGGIALVAVVAGLLVLKPWQKPAPVEPTPVSSVSTGQPAATDPAPPVQQAPAPATPDPAAQTQTPAGQPAVGTKEDGSSRIHEQPSSTAPAATPNIRQPAPSGAQLAKDKTAYDEMRKRIEQVRAQAQQAGATQADLSGGDVTLANAATMASRDRYGDAMNVLTDASNQYLAAANTARQRAAATALQQSTAPAPTPAQAAPATSSQPASEPAVDERSAVKLVVLEYAQAIAAGNLTKMSQIFPSMPKDQHDSYGELFRSGSQIVTSDWDPYSINVTGLNATATLQGTSRIRDKKGKEIAASGAPKAIKLQKVGPNWVITEVVAK